ncbi:FecR domain-containing protein [Paenibacillus sp. CC-CFT747]|nr:FecR domain-containing protein [Paenibacillus sp. CC-CFT747]
MIESISSLRRGGRKGAGLLLSLLLLVGLCPGLGTGIAAAKSGRVAVVTEVGGEATVKSAGGSRAYEVYVDMGLNQGDYIRTGDHSYVSIKLQDTGSEFTIDANSEVYLSELAKKGSGKTSKLRMWAGAIWSKIQHLTGTDEMEIETSSAVMGVRGTHWFVHANPATEETYVTAASGLVTVKDRSTGSQVLLLPTQQITVGPRGEVEDLDPKVTIVDVSELVRYSSPEVIERILRNKQDIDKELEEQKKTLEKQLANGGTAVKEGAASPLQTETPEKLKSVFSNFDQMVGNIVKEGLDQGKMNASEVNRLLQEMKEQSGGEVLNLSEVKPIDRSAGVSDEMKRLQAKLFPELEEQKEKLIQKQEQTILDALLRIGREAYGPQAEKRERLDQANEQYEKEQAEKAKLAYLSQLSGQEREDFLERAKKAEGGLVPGPGTGGGNVPGPSSAPTPTGTPERTPVVTPSPTPVPTTSAEPGGSPGSSATPTPTATPAPTEAPAPQLTAALNLLPGTVNGEDYRQAYLDITVQNVPAFYGVQVELDLSSRFIKADSATTSELLPSSRLESLVFRERSGSRQQLIYAAAAYTAGEYADLPASAAQKRLLRLPLLVDPALLTGEDMRFLVSKFKWVSSRGEAVWVSSGTTEYTAVVRTDAN